MLNRKFFRRAMLASALSLAVSIPVISQAQITAPAPMPARIDLQDGDTLVFLGDSITHQRLYTQYVEDFFYLRFPDRRINFHNAGVGGAQAWDALARLSRDVIDYKPRYVTILLGMNDGRYQPFHPEIFATYQQDMTEVVSRLRAAGATPVLMSPTMFDARAARANTRRPRPPEMLEQYNSVLAYFGRWLQDTAMESGTSYVDMFGPLNDLTIEERERDPAFTLIRDAIHPDPPGQLIMAYAMIDDLGLRSALSSIRILPTPKGGFRSTATGGKMMNLKQTDAGLEFDWTARALPWVVPEEAQLGADLLKLGHKASREALEIHGLTSGLYQILIDDQDIGNFTDVALSRHIELQGNAATPQYAQAMEVVLLNKQKNEGPVKELRDGWRAFQGWARIDRAASGNPDDTALAAKAEAGRKRLAGLEAQIIKSEAAAREIEDQIYKVNQPVTRHYVIRKVQ